LQFEPAAIERAAAVPRGSWVLIVYRIYEPHCQSGSGVFLYLTAGWR